MAYKSKSIPIEQTGAIPGRSAIEMGLHKVVVLKTVRLQRLYEGIIYNDAKASYYCIIENISNIALLQHGLLVKIAKLLHKPSVKLTTLSNTNWA
jgi:hypothetical protein